MHFVHKICPISCTNSRNLLHEFKKFLHIYYYFRARKTHKNFVHRAILYPTNSCIIVHNRPFLVHEINKSCIRALNNPNKIYARKKIYARIRETTFTSECMTVSDTPMQAGGGRQRTGGPGDRLPAGETQAQGGRGRNGAVADRQPAADQGGAGAGGQAKRRLPCWQ